MLINLVDGEPIRFGPEGRRGVVAGSDGALRIVDVDDVGVDALVVHDAERTDPSLAFALARLSKDDHSPTPVGVFRNVARPEYSAGVAAQLLHASERKGAGDLGALLRSNGTWRVEA
jgi:2-oxoglutarate ferredoxin oxidoreductase subunit beta